MYLSQQDLFTGLIYLSIITIVLLCIEAGVKNKVLNKLIGRKLLHFAAITTCAFTIGRFENRIALACIFLIFFFILLWVIRKGWMQVNEYKTYGIALFPLAFAVLLFIPQFQKPIIILAVLILAVSDALAGIAGEYYGKQKIVFLFETKSWIGFAAFYLSAFIVSIIFINTYTADSILFCSIFALLPALTELFSYRGSDNFTIPLFTAIWALLLTNTDTNSLLHFGLLILLFTAAAFFAVQKKWLTISGAAAAVWMAILLYTTWRYKAFVAPGIFLISGSLLSILNKHPREKKGRNAKQVFANGITGIVFMILYKITKTENYLIASMISFCISMADTVSSELGIYFKGATFDILSFKKMKPGLSGGISLQGTLAGLIGAALLSWVAGKIHPFSDTALIWIGFAGFTGMIIDSILGSWIQVKYKTQEGMLLEDQATGSQKIKGLAWCGNDTVNILSNVLITLLFFYLLS